MLYLGIFYVSSLHAFVHILCIYQYDSHWIWLSSSTFGLILVKSMSYKFRHLLVDQSTLPQLCRSCEHQHNGIVEWKHGHIIDVTRFSCLDLSRDTFRLLSFSQLFILLVSYPWLFYLRFFLMSVLILFLLPIYTLAFSVAHVLFYFLHISGLSFLLVLLFVLHWL